MDFVLSKVGGEIKMTLIMIDAGHGPETPGKRSPDGKLREFHFNSAVSDFVRDYLLVEGITVIFPHNSRKDVPLNERTTSANKMNVDAFVSIHANAYGTDWNSANGIETYIYTGAMAESISLANLVQSSLITACNRRNRGVKRADFAVIRQTKMPAILVECGFMTNREEANLLMNKLYQKRCAQAIAFALSSWLYRGRK